eukprot:766607-Prymnesium_polylepis.1
MAYTETDSKFPVPWSFLATGSTAAFIVLGCLPKQRAGWCGLPVPLLNACIGCAPIAYIGRLSYPLYLWHWPIFVCCKWSVGLETAGTRLGALCLTWLLAANTGGTMSFIMKKLLI